MPMQPQLFPTSTNSSSKDVSVAGGQQPGRPGANAPVWLQRLSLSILVLFCLYLGSLMAFLPWWKDMWDRNPLLLAHPQVLSVLQNGAVRGFISGLGLLDVWIGLSELIQYRDYRG